MKIIAGARLQRYDQTGSMGVVNDVRYVRCYWPKLDLPVALFAKGSSGIEVEGPPTPRNVVFPSGTRFLNGTRGDCYFLRTKVEAMRRARPGLPDKVDYDEYVAELPGADVAALIAGRKTEAELRADREFVDIGQEKPPIRTGKAG